MTGEIRSLDDRTVREIAAGEVVERPASVVKELVENALDAGAGRVAVAVENGGIDGVRVRDDGAGIPPEELPMAVAKHATSKLEGMDDLDSGVATLGFRGEALHSVGAVARLTVRSRTPDADTGAELTVDHGDEGEVEPAGCPVGTTVEVRDLFGRTPARRKFLKTPATEFDRVNGVVSAYALANPDVAVSLEHDGREVFASPGDGNRRSAVLAVYGREVAESMVEVDHESADGRIAVSGLVSHPETTRASREYLTTYVNDRWVRESDLRGAVVDAYGGQLATDRYPFAVLFVDVPRTAVDVNVHPRKTEVRFGDDADVMATVREGVRAALLDHGLVRSSAPRGRSAPDETSVNPEVVGGAGTDHERAAAERREDDETANTSDSDGDDSDGSGSNDDSDDSGSNDGDSTGGDADDRDSPSPGAKSTSSVLDAWGGSDSANSEESESSGAAAGDETGVDGTDAGGTADTGGTDAAGDDAWSVEVSGTDRPTDHPTRGRTDATAGDAPSPRSWQSDDVDRETDGDDGNGDDRGRGRATVDSDQGGDGGDADSDRPGDGSDDARDRSWGAPSQATLAGGTTDERTDHDRLPAMRVLGQYDDTYVVCETDAGLVLVDQHAADERVNYERLRAAVAGDTPAQTLAAPVELPLTAREAELFETFRDALREVGFRAERVDGDGDRDRADDADRDADADAVDRAVAVTAVPAVFDATLDPDLLREVLAAFADEVADGGRPVAEVADALLADLACYPSVTGNTSLTEGSVADLLDALDDCENPYACPHGRPVLVEFGTEEIDERFERDYPGHGGRRDE
ncbi:DNA mismatch repair endonuclease MutL [Halobaculum sp. CBA1158]|uniref:DNA mismatch repair endonuclease MutL n=1 Tax=Halobaculum sp. CBA1158 TaxID=2904243 RepID=UPI001F48941A|nr:DNA mismatch repair endonuclease MutL [Halobaculum sp. CBA1158]UIP00770.1 DNA mismatch repair endonuclease MutL [Halobaculum sp. CBA1158]